MSLKMCNLLDIEKYLLLEIAYFHLPSEFKNKISRETPMKLDVYIDLLDQCGCSMYPAFISRSQKGKKYIKSRQANFRRIYATSDNLEDVVITGYMNDNYGSYGNTKEKRKTSFVGLAFEDSDNNAAVSFSGCELMYPSSIVLDWGGCLVASLGRVTNHHQKALAFYDANMRGILGERNILGHSKGGNLATYVFINRLTEAVNAYCINAQPYCWYAMNDIQKEALKTDRFEYIVHAEDLTRKASYVSYISRTAPINRYAAKRIINIHGFNEVNFDEFGNLEGTRVIRETTNKLKSKIFKDFTGEKHLSYEECILRFQEKIEASTSVPRLFSTTLDEVLMVTDALAAVLWLKDKDRDGEYIYPVIIKSPSAERFYQLKLRNGHGIAAQCAFEGLPLFVRDSNQTAVHFEEVGHALGIAVSSGIAVPLGIDEKEVFGALELINKKNGRFTMEDFALVNDMTLAMLEVFKKSGQIIDSFRDFSLLRIRRGNEKLFSIEKHAYQKLLFSSSDEKETFLKMITGRKLKADELFFFNRRKFDFGKKEELKALVRREYAIMFEDPQRRYGNECVEVFLKAALWQVRDVRDKRIWAESTAKRIGLGNKLKTPVKKLSETEYIFLEYAAARIKHPMLIVVNAAWDGQVSTALEVVCNQLKQDCLNKTATAIVLKVIK
ncbi:GAF domain-containing protein [Acetobacterium paludosum]|uniref:GAF domain-containing protein n=1 Tax=Acetobacterium paludosum TaxID=52693 RepID=A0A923HWM8_9FIRM|nr:GAF domain-containing protein [Acetobacterium paludosum]MBC3888565.1 GAF domain-containing protein [Acetobacterium paludosum]